MTILAGQLALVTGASRGIGLAIAEALAAAGARVVMVSRGQAALEAARAASPHLAAAIVAPFDLAEPAGIAAWYDTLLAAHGPIDIVVNNAGISIRAAARDIALPDFEQVHRVNVDAVFALSQAFARACLAAQRPGRIINITSVTAHAAPPTPSVAYVATKGALLALTRQLAVEWAPTILVNAIAPGYIRTEMTEGLTRPGFESWLHARVPLGRWGEPEDVAGAALFLASPAARFITGSTITVDGGLLAAM